MCFSTRDEAAQWVEGLNLNREGAGSNSDCCHLKTLGTILFTPLCLSFLEKKNTDIRVKCLHVCKVVVGFEALSWTFRSTYSETSRSEHLWLENTQGFSEHFFPVPFFSLYFTKLEK